MGDAVWQEFGERSFVIATTAYGGQFQWRAVPPGWPSFSVVSDQERGFELEELLAAAGTGHAVLDLRNVGAGGEWLRAPLSSRAWWNYLNVRASWPDHADALLLLRSITPRTTAAGVDRAAPR